MLFPRWHTGVWADLKFYFFHSQNFNPPTPLPFPLFFSSSSHASFMRLDAVEFQPLSLFFAVKRWKLPKNNNLMERSKLASGGFAEIINQR